MNLLSDFGAGYIGICFTSNSGRIIQNELTVNFAAEFGNDSSGIGTDINVILKGSYECHALASSGVQRCFLSIRTLRMFAHHPS